jgi:NAD(P)-dependent dehydrogenase (short-subunit alcohol dehydrogenase family)
MTDHVLITGTGSGIGLALARAFLAAGWQVTGIDRAPGALDDPGYAHTVCDITDAAAMDRAFDAATAHAPLRAVIANAAVTDMAHRSVLDQHYATWRKVLDVNVNGAFVTARAAARRLVPAGGGNITFITSSLAFLDQAKANDAPYCASKSAVEMLMRVLSLELAGTGVNVNTLFPSTRIDTGFFSTADAAEKADLDPPTILNQTALLLSGLTPGTLTGHSLDQQRWDIDAAYRAELGGQP